MFFHMSDAYQFFNEIVKTQATSSTENDLFNEYDNDSKKQCRTFGRVFVGSTLVPYLYVVSMYRGFTWKFATFYVIYRMLDAIYDSGMYARFFLFGPSAMKRLAQMDT